MKIEIEIIKKNSILIGVIIICIILVVLNIYQKSIIDDLNNRRLQDTYQFVNNIEGENENWKLEDAFIFRNNYASFVNGGVLKYKDENYKVDYLSASITVENSNIISTRLEYGIPRNLFKEGETIGKLWSKNNNFIKNEDLKDKKIYAEVEYRINGEIKKEKFRIKGEYDSID